MGGVWRNVGLSPPVLILLPSPIFQPSFLPSPIFQPSFLTTWNGNKYPRGKKRGEGGRRRRKVEKGKKRKTLALISRRKKDGRRSGRRGMRRRKTSALKHKQHQKRRERRGWVVCFGRKCLGRRKYPFFFGKEAKEGSNHKKREKEELEIESSSFQNPPPSSFQFVLMAIWVQESSDLKTKENWKELSSSFLPPLFQSESKPNEPSSPFPPLPLPKSQEKVLPFLS